MSAFQDAPKPRIVRFIRGFTNFSVNPYYDPLLLVMITEAFRLAGNAQLVKQLSLYEMNS